MWLLLKNGADVNLRGYLTQTPLHGASIESFPDVVRWLFGPGVDLNAQRCKKKSTALHLAEFTGRLDVAEILLEHSADVNACDVQGRVPLHGAARCGHLELVR